MTNGWRSPLEAMFPALSASIADNSAFPLTSRPVLVVEAGHAWAEQCGFALRDLGYEPLIARAPDEALSLLMARPVAIAVIDYDLPGSDGLLLGHDLARAATAQGRTLHVIVVTGQDARNVAIDALRASAADVLEKPIRLPELRQALQRVEGLDPHSMSQTDILAAMASLSAQMQRIARLLEPAEAPPAPASSGAPQEGPPIAVEPLCNSFTPPTPVLINHIRELLKKESRRRRIGGGDVFGDPAWEMLLDLMLAKIEGRRVSVSSACIASGAPMSTALRLVGRLVEEDVLQKIPDSTDRRRHFLVINARFERPFLEYLTEQVQQKPDA